MSNVKNTKNAIYRMTCMAVLSAIIIVLQVVTTFFPIKPFAITLSLIPILVGAALFDEKAGAFLGAVFSAVVITMCITGVDAGGAMVWNASPFLCILVCMLKGTVAGYVSGLLYRIISKKNTLVATLVAGITAPIVNTGIFAIGMILFFKPVLIAWAGGTSLLYYVLTAIIGFNFLIEFGVNIILVPVIIKIIEAVNKSRKF